jgi:hypothetical protein
MTTHTKTIPAAVTLATALLLMMRGAAARAADEVPEAEAAADAGLIFETDRVVVFKDGYGLFVKHATGVVGADGLLYTDAVPPAAVLGTFWATADGHDILSLKAEWVERKSSRDEVTDCLTVLDLLRANQGRALSLEMTYGQTITGKLVDVLEIPPAPDGSAAGGGQLAVMATPTGTMVLPLGLVRSITGDEVETRMTRTTAAATRTKRLWFDLGPEAEGSAVTLRMFYFTSGIRWIPTYRLGGELKYDGHLALQGEILNEVEDIDGAVLDLVVGVPNFRFKGTISPLSLERVMVNALAHAAPGLMAQQMRNASFSQRESEWRGHAAPAPPAGGGVADLAPELSAAGEQDLFVYTVESLTLAKGARAAVALWESSVPLRHLYTMEVEVARGSQSGGGFGASSGASDQGHPSPLRLARNEVWHQLELPNRSEVPWTTGAVMLLRAVLPLGQELLTYTPRGGRVLVPVTVAVDVRGTHEEQEIDREPNALRWSGRDWARIRKRGTVTVTNYRDEPADMLISVSTGGKAESASGDATIKISAARAEDFNGGHAAINNHSEIAWTLTLDPGETRGVSYVVSYYVR